MFNIKKIGIIFILIGLCIPTVSLPFVSEFHPVPGICLTSNFFGNLGNMVVVFGDSLSILPGESGDTLHRTATAIPYRYIFSAGVILFFTGVGMILLSTTGKK